MLVLLENAPLVSAAQGRECSRHFPNSVVVLLTFAAAPAPSNAPLTSVDTSQRLRHVINYKDSARNGAKPPGVAHCEIWNTVGVPPRDRE